MKTTITITLNLLIFFSMGLVAYGAPVDRCYKYTGPSDQTNGIEVKFDTNRFEDWYYVRFAGTVPGNDDTQRYCYLFDGDSKPRLQPGKYVLMIGSDITHDFSNPIYFDLSSTGKISGITNTKAVKLSSDAMGIEFQTTKVRINPGNFAGDYKLVSNRASRPCSDADGCVLVRNLAYGIRFNGYTDGNVWFFVNDLGRVTWTTNRLAAWGANPSGQIPRVDLTSDEVFFTSQLATQAAIKINNGPTLSLPTSQWIIRGVSFYVKYSIDPTKPMPENSLRFFSGYDGVIPEELLFDFGAGRKEALQLCSRRPKFQFEALKNCPVS